MYEVTYDGLTSYVSNYFYCCIRPEGLLCDVKRDLLIAKFLAAYLTKNYNLQFCT